MDPSSSLDSQTSLNKVCTSLQKVLELRQEAQESSSSSTTVMDVSSPTEAVELLESCDSQVTIMADCACAETRPLPCSVSFVHTSAVFDSDGEGHTLSPSLQSLRTRPKTIMSKDISNMFIGEMELEIPSDGEDSAIDFEVKSLSPSLHEEDEDSGCATSIGSPDKTSSLDFRRPGLLQVPEGLLQEIDGGSTRREEDHQSSLEMSSNITNLSSQSPSSVGGEGQKDATTDQVKEDEWPDLCMEENQDVFKFPPPTAPSLLPPFPTTNGLVRPSPSQLVPPSSSSNNGQDSDPSLWMATITSHIRQQQQAVYQHHANAMMFNGSYPPPPLPPPPAMFGGHGPNSFPGFYPPPPPFPPPHGYPCLLYTSPSPRDATLSRMPSSA